jgi:hypothetical protein
MLNLLILTIGVFLVVFIDHFLFSILAFSLYALIAINMFNRVSPFLFYSFVILGGLIMDVTMHQPLGVNLLVLSIALVVFWLLGIAVPVDGRVPRYLSLSVFFVLFYLLSLIITSLIQDSAIPYISASFVVKAGISTVISVLITFVLDKLFFSVRDSRYLEGIRLK